MLKYQTIEKSLKKQIQQGIYNEGDYLPSENELCRQFSITRTTARKALDELLKAGFIEKLHGKGSRVVERRKALGLLAVQGFSEAAGKNMKTIFLQKPGWGVWNGEIFLPVCQNDKDQRCLFFERLRFVDDAPVMLEKNWFPDQALPGFTGKEFYGSSFFKTLSKEYLIEIVGSQSELRAEIAGEELAKLLQIKKNAPILHISIKFKTSSNKLNIYSELYCNTEKFPIGNSYVL